MLMPRKRLKSLGSTSSPSYSWKVYCGEATAIGVANSHPAGLVGRSWNHIVGWIGVEYGTHQGRTNCEAQKALAAGSANSGSVSNVVGSQVLRLRQSSTVD